MTLSRKHLGDFGEGVAQGYLRKRGYRILETNFRCAIGEIDIVARDGGTLVFVEVKTRRGIQWGAPEESITPAKTKKLIELAQSYLQQNEGMIFEDWRIDAVAVEVDNQGKVFRIEQIESITE